tara:strand:+ start:3042 stop:7328 length:4287 start_codon:yes stop_codon:yes gene_type:complete
MPIAGTGPLTFGTLADNNNSGSKSNLRIASLSDTFASGSSVGDVNNDGTINDTDRNLLKAAPHLLSEFRGAEATNVFFGPITPQIASDGTSVVGGAYVDEEAAQITFYVTDDAKGNQYKVGVKDGSSNAILASNTDTVSSGDGANRTITFTAPATTEGNDKYYAFVESTSDPFANVNNTGQLLDHFDRLTGGYTSITNGSQFVDAEDEAVNNVELTPTVSTGVQTSTSIGTTLITGGDGEDISVTNTSGTIYSIQNTPGVLRFDVTHIGNPSQARNNDTSTATVDVRYNSAIDGIAVDDTTVNSGQSFTISAVSEGVQSKTLKIGYGTSNTNTTYTGDSDKSISDTRYARSAQSQAFSVTLTSGTSLVQYYPKAHYTDDTGTLVAGTAFNVAPAFSYSATGNTTIDIDQTAEFGISSLVGNGASIIVASSPNIGGATLTANGTTTMDPNDTTGNGTYTISYTGTANYSQTNNASNATLTVRPKITSLLTNNETPFGLLGSYTSGLTPTGTTNESFTITAATQGAALTYNWGSLPTNFTKTAGGGAAHNYVTGYFSGGSAGGRTFSLTVTGNSVTSTTASETVTYTGYTQQSISSVAPTSGTYRRGVTTLSVTWQSRNVAYAKILLIGVSTGTADKTFTASTDSLDSATANDLENQSYSATVTDVGVGDVGTYTVRVLDASDDNPSTDALSQITIADQVPTTPGAFQDTAGGYNGSLTMDWAASSYRYQYQIYKSAGDSDASYSQLGSNQTGTSVVLNEASSTSTYGPFYYKVRALNFAQGPLSTEYSSYNTPRRFIIYPTLGANNNIPQPNVSTIYSTVENSTTTLTVMNVTSDSDNTNMSYSWATSLTTGASISSTTAKNPTITAGAGVGTITATLTVTADANAQSYAHSGDNITVNYYPKIYNISYSTANLSGGNFVVNSSTVTLTVLDWQGFDCGGSGFSVGVYTAASSGGSEESSIGAVTLNGTDLTDAIIDNNTGGAQIRDPYCKWTGGVSLGTISSTGTVYVRVTDLGGSGTVGYTALTVAAWNSVSVISKSSGNWDDGEEAYVGNSAGAPDTKSYLGTLDDDTVLYNDANGTGGVFDGSSKWHRDSTNSYVMVVNGSGVVSSYTADANIIPKAPTSLAISSESVTGVAVASLSAPNYVYGSGTTTNSFTKTTTYTVNLSWNDNSDIEDGFKVYNGGTTTLGEDVESYAHTGQTSSDTYTVKAYRGTGLSATPSGVTSTVANNATLYFTTSGGTQLGTTTSATSHGWGNEVLAPGSYTIQARKDSYSGTILDTDSVTVSGTTPTWYINTTPDAADSVSSLTASTVYYYTGLATNTSATGFTFLWVLPDSETDITFTGSNCTFSYKAGEAAGGTSLGAGTWSSYVSSATVTPSSAPYRYHFVMKFTSAGGGGTIAPTITAGGTGYTNAVFTLTAESASGKGGE